jgi:hypothetical protein
MVNKRKEAEIVLVVTGAILLSIGSWVVYSANRCTSPLCPLANIGLAYSLIAVGSGLILVATFGFITGMRTSHPQSNQRSMHSVCLEDS